MHITQIHRPKAKDMMQQANEEMKQAKQEQAAAKAVCIF